MTIYEVYNPICEETVTFTDFANAIACLNTLNATIFTYLRHSADVATFVADVTKNGPATLTIVEK